MSDKTFSIIGNDLVNELLKVLEGRYPEVGSCEGDKEITDPYKNMYKTGQRSVVLYIKKWLTLREQRELDTRNTTE
ncbi:MAG: hypothetical protein WC981_03940 [Candidatus Dojkabacteria bacterium]